MNKLRNHKTPDAEELRGHSAKNWGDRVWWCGGSLSPSGLPIFAHYSFTQATPPLSRELSTHTDCQSCVRCSGKTSHRAKNWRLDAYFIREGRTLRAKSPASSLHLIQINSRRNADKSHQEPHLEDIVLLLLWLLISLLLMILLLLVLS